MKKTLVSLLFSAALVFSAMPMLQAEASQMEAVSMDSMRVETGTFGVEGRASDFRFIFGHAE